MLGDHQFQTLSPCVLVGRVGVREQNHLHGLSEGFWQNTDLGVYVQSPSSQSEFVSRLLTMQKQTVWKKFTWQAVQVFSLKTVMTISGVFASRFPVILSIENHCSIQQQKKIAQYMKEIFGDKLDLSSVVTADSRQLPSPQNLKGKILVKVTCYWWCVQNAKKVIFFVLFIVYFLWL